MDILGGRAVSSDMAILAGTYVLAIAIVQIARYLKRFYVRRFANNISRQMKRRFCTAHWFTKAEKNCTRKLSEVS